jgi:hypothetical protein
LLIMNIQHIPFIFLHIVFILAVAAVIF